MPTFTDRYHSHFTRDANACVELGVPRRRNELPDPSAAEAQATVAEAKGLLAALEHEAPSLDADLARLALLREVHNLSYTFNGRPAHAQLPQAGDVVGNGIFTLFINDPRPAGERLADITGRLEQVPACCDAMLGRLDTPVKRWVDIDLEKVESLPSLFDTIEAWAEQVAWPDGARLTRAAEGARAALVRYAAGLRALPTTNALHVGDETARRIVALRGIELSLEQIHANAVRFQGETAAMIEELRGVLVDRHGLPADTDTATLHAFLNEKFRVNLPDGRIDSVLVRYQAERERVLAFIEERDLFPILPDQDMKLLRTPKFMEPSIPAGAMMSPQPFRDGTRTSLVYLTLREDLIDEHTELGIPMMMIHEGIPGHHLQLATASTHPSIIRRHTEAMDQAEGWTTMLEDYMLDQGYMGDLTDEARFSGKRDISRIGARVAIDLYFMTGDRGYLEIGVDCDISSDDPFVAAGSLLQAVTGFSPGRVQAELNWYSQERGYPLSYLTGNTLVWQLKRDVAARWTGSAIDMDRAFHRAFLEAGAMPVAVLRREFTSRGLLGPEGPTS